MSWCAAGCGLLLVLVCGCHVVLSGEVMRGGMVGGWNILDPMSEQVQNVAKKGVQLFNMEDDQPTYYRLVKVLSAQAQVTNALNYKITAVLGETKCSKSEDVAPDKCELGEKRMRCDFQITYSFQYDGARVSMTCRPMQGSLSQ